MEYDLEFKFEELGLQVKGGWSIGFFDGTATITFDDDGDWWITGIALEKRKLDGSKWLDGEYVFKGNADDSPLYHLLCTAIERVHSARIAEDVAAELHDDEPLTYTSQISAGRTYA